MFFPGMQVQSEPSGRMNASELKKKETEAAAAAVAATAAAKEEAAVAQAMANEAEAERVRVAHNDEKRAQQAAAAGTSDFNRTGRFRPLFRFVFSD